MCNYVYACIIFLICVNVYYLAAPKNCHKVSKPWVKAVHR